MPIIEDKIIMCSGEYNLYFHFIIFVWTSISIFDEFIQEMLDFDNLSKIVNRLPYLFCHHFFYWFSFFSHIGLDYEW